ncbi:MAG: DUF4168 domain-containing protein [Pseudomonadota bacterium]
MMFRPMILQALRRPTLPLALALGLIVLGVPAMAQNGSVPSMSSDDVNEETLRSFAVAALEVDAIAHEWTVKMQEAGPDADVSQMQAEAQNEMIQAVRDEGLSVEEYAGIRQLAEVDAAVNAEIQRLITEQMDR